VRNKASPESTIITQRYRPLASVDRTTGMLLWTSTTTIAHGCHQSKGSEEPQAEVHDGYVLMANCEAQALIESSNYEEGPGTIEEALQKD
jgi:hypothetical protein